MTPSPVMPMRGAMRTPGSPVPVPNRLSAGRYGFGPEAGFGVICANESPIAKCLGWFSKIVHHFLRRRVPGPVWGYASCCGGVCARVSPANKIFDPQRLERVAVFWPVRHPRKGVLAFSNGVMCYPSAPGACHRDPGSRHESPHRIAVGVHHVPIARYGMRSLRLPGCRGGRFLGRRSLAVQGKNKAGLLKIQSPRRAPTGSEGGIDGTAMPVLAPGNNEMSLRSMGNSHTQVTAGYRLFAAFRSRIQRSR